MTRHDVGAHETLRATWMFFDRIHARTDELAARHAHLTTVRKRVQHEQHRGGIVVDYGGVLRVGQIG